MALCFEVALKFKPLCIHALLTRSLYIFETDENRKIADFQKPFKIDGWQSKLSRNSSLNIQCKMSGQEHHVLTISPQRMTSHLSKDHSSVPRFHHTVRHIGHWKDCTVENSKIASASCKVARRLQLHSCLHTVKSEKKAATNYRPHQIAKSIQYKPHRKYSMCILQFLQFLSTQKFDV